jgi:hypothetical protein
MAFQPPWLWVPSTSHPNLNVMLFVTGRRAVEEGVFHSGRAVDVWAMGISLYLMAFGRLPYVLTSVTHAEVDKATEEAKK